MRPDDLIGPAVIHSRGSIIYANQEFCGLIGKESPKQLENQSLTQFVTAPDREPLQDIFERIATEEADTLGHRVTLTGDDAEGDYIAVSSLVTWEQTPRTRTVFVNISQLGDDGHPSLRETALHEAPVGITIADITLADDPLIYVNNGFVELTGYSRDEILGQNCRVLQGPATRERPVAKMRAALRAEQPVTVKLRNYRNDGSMFWNRVTLFPVENADETVTHYLGFQENISTDKTHEEERFLFETYAEKADTPMFIVGADETIEYVNPAFERITGYSSAEAIGEDLRALQHSEQDEVFPEDLSETITAGDTWQADLTNRTKSGALYEITQRITPITDTRGELQYYVVVEHERTDEQLRQQVLAVLNRILRHNVRNSVTVIDGYAELIESNPDDPDVEAMAIAIRDHTTRLERLAEQTATIRTLIGLIEGRKKSSPVQLSKAVSIAERYSETYDNALIDVTSVDVTESEIRYGPLVDIAFKGLIENAVEHNDQEPPRVEVRITEIDESDGAKARIEVADNGPEIPKSQWEIIKAGEETPLRHTEGVGLWVVYWAVTILGGTVELSANEPRGNVITMRLPLTSPST